MVISELKFGHLNPANASFPIYEVYTDVKLAYLGFTEKLSVMDEIVRRFV